MRQSIQDIYARTRLQSDKARKTRAAGLAGVSALALALAGCGDKEGGSSDKGQSSSGKAEISSITGGKSSLDKAYSLKGGAETDIAKLTSALEMGDSFTYDSAKFDKSKGATILTNVTAPNEDGEFKIGKVELYGVETGNIETVKAGEGDEILQMFDRIRLYDLSFNGVVNTTFDEPASENKATAPQSTFTIAAMEVDTLKLRPSSEEKMDALEGGQGLAALLNNFNLGGVTIKDMKLESQNGDEMGIDFDISEVRFGGIGGGKIGGIALSGLAYNLAQSDEMRADMIKGTPQMSMLLNGPLANFVMPQSQNASAKSFTWGGMDISGWLPYLEKNEMPPADAKNLVKFKSMEVRDIKSLVNGKVASDTPSSIVEDVEFAWLIPSKIRASSKNSTVNLSAYVPDGQPEMATLLKDNKVESIGYDGAVSWDYDEKKGTAALDYDIDMSGLADIDLEFNTSEMPLDALVTAFESKSPEGIANGALNGFRLKIADEKLLDTAFGIAGLQAGKDGAALRQQYAAQLSMMGIMGASMNERIPGYVTALSGFLNSGGTLEIAVAPEKPVNFMSLAMTGQTAPQTLPDVLNLTVTHSE